MSENFLTLIKTFIYYQGLLLMLIDHNPCWRNWQYASKNLSLLIVKCISLTGKNENHAYHMFVYIVLYIKQKLCGYKFGYLKYDIFLITFRGSWYERPYNLPEGLVFLDFSFHLYKVMVWISMSSHNYFLIPSLSRKIRFAKR